MLYILLAYLMLYIMLAYLMLLTAIFDAVCLYNTCLFSDFFPLTFALLFMQMLFVFMLLSLGY